MISDSFFEGWVDFLDGGLPVGGDSCGCGCSSGALRLEMSPGELSWTSSEDNEEFSWGGGEFASKSDEDFDSDDNKNDSNPTAVDEDFVSRIVEDLGRILDG